MEGLMGHGPESLRARYAAAGTPSLAGILLDACMTSAAHSNPFDPNSEGFQGGSSLEGEVIRMGGTGLSGAFVRLKPGSYAAMRGEDGRFQRNGVPAGTHARFISKDGLGSDSSTAEIQPGEVTQIVRRVDALPIISGVAVRVGHIGRHAPQTNLHVLDVRATIDDPGSRFDLDSEWMDVPRANYTGGLDVTTNLLRFRASVAASDLSHPPMHTFAGKSVLLYARDRAGFVVSMPAAIVRVVDPVPVAVCRHVATGGGVEFTWQAVSLPHPFTYRVDVHRMLGSNVQERYNSPAHHNNEKTSSFRFENIPPGDYFWTISVVDEFGNWSQSAPAGFSVP